MISHLYFFVKNYEIKSKNSDLLYNHFDSLSHNFDLVSFFNGNWHKGAPNCTMDIFEQWKHYVCSRQVRIYDLSFLVLQDSLFTFLQHSLPPQFPCWTCYVWLQAVPGLQVYQRRQSRNIQLFQICLTWALHILGWMKLQTAEKKKSGRCEFPQKHPCL